MVDTAKVSQGSSDGAGGHDQGMHPYAIFLSTSTKNVFFIWSDLSARSSFGYVDISNSVHGIDALVPAATRPGTNTAHSKHCGTCTPIIMRTKNEETQGIHSGRFLLMIN